MYWYRQVPDKWLAGTRNLTFEEKGVYIDLINIWIDRDGNLKNDDQLLARILCCQLRTWCRLKAALIIKDKLHETEGNLIPNGCEKTRKESEKFQINSDKIQKNLNLQAKNLAKSTNGDDTSYILHSTSYSEDIKNGQKKPDKEARRQQLIDEARRRHEHGEPPLVTGIKTAVDYDGYNGKHGPKRTG